MISPSTIQQVLSSARADEIIEDYVQLKRRGANLLGLCPFHGEKTPSFTVSPVKNLWKCFGCGRGGDAIGFLKEHEGFSYVEAIKYLAKKYNIEVVETNTPEIDQEEVQKRESLFLLNQFAKDFFKQQLIHIEEGRSIGLSYLKHRGINQQTIERYDLGYAPKDGSTLYQQARASLHNIEWMQELGLISTSNRDFYRERVMFPFHNLSGKIIGFGGRIMTNDKKAPKYLNSPESDIYNKRKTLYGLYQARQSIRSEGFCVLVEGYTDVLSLSQNGVENVVASSGTSLTSEQVTLIKRFSKDVIVLYDGDEAGQKAALRGLDIFLENELNVKVLMLPPNDDPDSYMRNVGPIAFKQALIKDSKDFIILLSENIEQNTKNDPVNKTIQVRELSNSIAKITDPLKRALYSRECARRLNLNEESLIREINKRVHEYLKKKKSSALSPSSDTGSSDYAVVEKEKDRSQLIGVLTNPLIVQERDIAKIIIISGEKTMDEQEKKTVAQYIIEELEDVKDNFTDELAKKIIEETIRALDKSEFRQQLFLHHADEAISSFATDMLIEKYDYANWADKGVELQTQKAYEENFVKESAQSVLRLKLRLIQQKITELRDRIQQTDDDQMNVVLLTVHQHLIQVRQQLAQELGVTVF